MTLRKPLTRTHDEIWVPFSIVDGTLPRHPPKIVIHSSNRLRSEASFQAASGSRSDDVETSTRAKACRSSSDGDQKLPTARPSRNCIPGCRGPINQAVSPLGSLGPGLV